MCPTTCQTMCQTLCDEHKVEMAEPLCDAIAVLLRQLSAAIAAVSPSIYTERAGPEFLGATIGGHVRHCLDHVHALFPCDSKSEIDYDHRIRGTPTEIDPSAAASALRTAAFDVSRLSASDLSLPVSVKVIYCAEGLFSRSSSTLGRETAFVLSHTTHHMAMIRGMLVQHGIAVPAEFGYAPSTLNHEKSKSCVR